MGEICSLKKEDVVGIVFGNKGKKSSIRKFLSQIFTMGLKAYRYFPKEFPFFRFENLGEVKWKLRQPEGKKQGFWERKTFPSFDKLLTEMDNNGMSFFK
ncbi:MAG: hypothetical protein CM15mP88_3120 [Pseudomonadota bacterium]|nr:MAG: hypothetical protein CM15mP88_3120 [Pseudomonadota bacterium]